VKLTFICVIVYIINRRNFVFLFKETQVSIPDKSRDTKALWDMLKLMTNLFLGEKSLYKKLHFE